MRGKPERLSHNAEQKRAEITEMRKMTKNTELFSEYLVFLKKEPNQLSKNNDRRKKNTVLK